MTNGARESHPQHENANESQNAGGTPAYQGWHSRGYLPHCDYPGLVQAIGFRLFDSVPVDVIETWKRALGHLSDDRLRSELNNRIDKYADLGHGGCFLAEQRIGELVENAFLHFDDDRYDLLAWCVMSNHVHVLAVPRLGFSLSDIVQSWKSFTAKEANKVLGRKGQFWAPDYFDEFMKSTSQLEATIEYIERNPVNAKLASQPDQWRFSSAASHHQQRVKRARAKFPDIDPEQLP